MRFAVNYSQTSGIITCRFPTSTPLSLPDFVIPESSGCSLFWAVVHIFQNISSPRDECNQIDEGFGWTSRIRVPSPQARFLSGLWLINLNLFKLSISHCSWVLSRIFWPIFILVDTNFRPTINPPKNRFKDLWFIGEPERISSICLRVGIFTTQNSSFKLLFLLCFIISRNKVLCHAAHPQLELDELSSASYLSI